MMRRKKPIDQYERETDLATARRESRANPIKRKPGPKVGKALKKQHDQPDIDLDSFDRILGLDPGRKSLFVTCDMEKNHLHCPTKQFYHNAKYNEGNRKTSRWIDNDPMTQEAVRNMPKKETCDIMTFESCIIFLLPRLDKLLRFFQQRKFSSQKFKRFCKKKLRELSLKIADGKKTLVGFGHWSNTDTSGVIKKCPAGPVKKLEQELRK